jgi:hypothetical protein
MSRRARLILVLVGLLLVMAAMALLAYALRPLPVESVQATLIPTLLTPPGGIP